MLKPYRASIGGDEKPYVNGPGEGLSFHAGTLWPELRFDREEDAERAAKIANIAYHEGCEQTKRDIRAKIRPALEPLKLLFRISKGKDKTND